LGVGLHKVFPLVDKVIKTILTKEQQKQFDAYVKNKHPQAKNGGKRPPKK